MNYLYTKVNPKLVLMLCLCFMQINIFAQSNVRISIKNDRITIRQALQEVEKQSKMSVAYNESKLNGDRSIQLNIKDQPLDTVLNEILAGTDFSYQLKDGYIMIIPAKKDEPQKKSISGKILDETGESLTGATVVVRGHNTGSITDIDGNFTLLAAKGDLLVISFLGYDSQNIRVTDQNRYDISMKPLSRDLDAVVVTALGIKRAQKALSYNVQEVGSDELTKVKDANFINALSGKVALRLE